MERKDRGTEREGGGLRERIGMDSDNIRAFTTVSIKGYNLTHSTTAKRGIPIHRAKRHLPT